MIWFFIQDFHKENYSSKKVSLQKKTIMFDFSQSGFSNLAVHFIGNKSNGESLKCSNKLLDLDDELLNDLLKRFFLQPFKEQLFYSFNHPSDINYNEVYTCCSKIFENPDLLLEYSVQFAQRLFNCSDHPQIKSGELYVVYFTDCIVEEELTDAIGIFKSETRDTYLKVYPQNQDFNISYDNGININRLDKGCLIFNTEAEHGFKVSIIDRINKGEEARFWKDQFLCLRQREDDFYLTRNMLQMCNNFVKEVLVEENNVEKPEQIKVKSKAVEYFQDNERFEARKFAKEVFEEPGVIDAFQEYAAQKVAQQQDLVFSESFDISPKAVKSAKKDFKSVIKLDKNFHIYVHGNPNLMEKGIEEDSNKKYYKLYFEEES